jgi:quinol monooxygenase YgiN
MRDALLSAVRENLPAVRDEQGCIEYGPTTDVEDAGSFQTMFGADTFVMVKNG